jgi:hypothetical protein
MKFVYDDGGRAAAGYKGRAGDCVTRAIAIVAEMPYEEIYERLSSGAGKERKSRGKTARNGVHTSRKWFKEFMKALGFAWTPTMGIGTGCKVHLTDGELPVGRIIARVSGHYTAVIDGVIHDTFDPQREAHVMTFNGASSSDDPRVVHSIQRRCVYGYWKLEVTA